MSDEPVCPGCGREVTVIQTIFWDPEEWERWKTTWHFQCRRRADFIEGLPSRLFQVEGIGL